MKKIINSKHMPYILMVLLTAVICIPIFTMNLYLNNEAILHMSRIFAIDEVIKDGVFPPIINYKFMNGFGYALNLFYGPLTTYIPIIFLNIFKTAGMALKVFTVLTVIISAITMYHFVYTVTKRKSMAVIAALIYISAPYKLSDIYSRNAVGEYTAFIFIPLVFESLYTMLNTDKKNSLMLSVGIIGLVLSHTITTVYIALFSAIYLLLNIKKLKSFKLWKNIAINIIIAFLVCSFYIVPLLEHSILGEHVIYHKDLMGTSGIFVQNTGLGLKDLFAIETGNAEIRFSIGIVTIILTILTVFCMKKVKEKYNDMYISFIILSVISLFMSTKLFPWVIMPSVFTVIQFAWRNIGFFAFFISLVCSINAVIFAENIIKKEIWKETFLFGTISAIFVFAFLGVLRDYRFDDVSKESDLDKSIRETERMYAYKINREYLPINAFGNLEEISKRENRTYILKGKANIITEEKNKLEDKIVLENIQNGTELELPYIYYLGYTANITYDHKTEKLDITESENGMLKVKLSEAKNAVIDVKYEGTILEKASYIISIIGVVIFIAYEIRGKKNGEKKN